MQHRYACLLRVFFRNQSFHHFTKEYKVIWFIEFSTVWALGKMFLWFLKKHIQAFSQLNA